MLGLYAYVFQDHGALTLKKYTLFNTLLTLRGNPRGCVYTEPLWGIPFNLYAPYISIYMVALGLSDKQIGLVASIGAAFQVIFALSSGVITDKLGRRLTTLIFDIISWSVPALISAIAMNFWYFAIAAAINSVWRVTQNSWNCLLVEDAEKHQLNDIFSWIYIANLVVGFAAPLAKPLIVAFNLIPTVRGLYLFAAVMFTVKAIATYRMTEETGQGKVRMHQTSQQSMLAVLGEYRHVLQDVLRSPQTLYLAGIMLVLGITTLVSGNFWAILVTEKLHLPNQDLALFPFVRSSAMLLAFFLVTPFIGTLHFKIPYIAGFASLIASQVMLVTAPQQNYWVLGLSVFLEAGGLAIVNPLTDRMGVLIIDPKERARIQSILFVGIILLTSPFGLIAGNLSALNKDLPFLMDIALFAVGVLLAYLAGRASDKAQAASEEASA
jgi:MFS family permease